MIAARNERRLIGATDKWGTSIRLEDTLRPCNEFIGAEGKLINHKGAYRIKIPGVNNLHCECSQLWHIGPKNYEVLR